jgi:hypothetical protein
MVPKLTRVLLKQRQLPVRLRRKHADNPQAWAALDRAAVILRENHEAIETCERETAQTTTLSNPVQGLAVDRQRLEHLVKLVEQFCGQCREIIDEIERVFDFVRNTGDGKMIAEHLAQCCKVVGRAGTG